MRILKLRLRNLNSLAGGWEIDFTHPAFADGIFAITGPTGAGKSTILDALCLALHGATPRLGRITQSGNEIMSRQRGECLAEVDFAAGQGGFRCSWQQRRSRNGVLQQAKRELSRLDGQIIAEKVKEVQEQIEQLTGMDFNRFTRSMLLAQGDFAAFLQTSPDERADILEKITGTGVYSDISKKTHERCKAEKEAQKRLQEQADRLRLLTADEEAALRRTLDELHSEEAQLKTEAERLAAALSWLKKVAALRQEIDKISAEQTVLALERQNFAAAADRLARAEQALVLEGDYAALAALRRQQNEDRDAAANLRGKLPELEAALKAAEERLRQSGDALAERKTEQAQGGQLIRQVREQDVRIEEKKAALKSKEAECVELRRQHDDALQNIERLELLGKDEEIRRQRSAAYLAEHQADQSLLAELTGICRQAEQAAALTKQLEAVSAACLAADKQLAASRQICLEKTEQHREAERLLAASSTARTEAEKRLAQLLQGRLLTELRQELPVLAQMTDLLRQQEKLAKDFAELHQQQEQNAAARNALHAKLNLLLEQRDAARLEEERRRAAAVFASRVRSLEEERARLQDHAPCPLCGALEHPYAQGSLPLLDEAEQAAKAAAAALRQIEEVLNKESKEQARLEQQSAHLADLLTKNSAAAQEAGEKISCCCAGLSIASEQTRLAEIELRLAENRRLVQDADALTEQINQLVRTLERQQAARAAAVQERDKAAAAQDKAEAEQRRLAARQQELRQELAEKTGQLARETAVYGISADFDKLPAMLTARKEAWQAQQDKCRAAEKQLAALQADMQALRAGLAARTEQAEAAARRRDELNQELKRMTADRAALFADKAPDAEEQRLAAAVTAAEEAARLAEERRQQAEQQLAQQNTLITGRETAAARNEPLQRQEKDFAQLLHDSGFADEAAWLSARLSAQQLAALRQQADALRRREDELQARRTDRQDQLSKEEQARPARELDEDKLRQEQDAVSSSRTEIIKQIGAAQERLAGNDQRRGEQTELLRQLEAQRRECLRWRDLDELIGSSDGKTYRNFAQGLTFAQMVMQANRQLARMSDRYRLLRDANQALELSVADAWQAGEIRSAKNLSGGESFVVSLALALGLSDMTGGKVESLFLDEGFGTLDDEALDAALDSLAELRREGRLIGVISHVAALKERIACQIEVLPGSGGQSALKGPGVRRL